MGLVTTTEMFKKAYDGGYAIGAFNVNNMEIVQGITEAAGELKSPVILQVSKGARAYANHTYLVKLVEAAVQENPEIPIALHLDHGDSFELCKSCIDGGFTSVMIDASSKSFEENIAITKQVVEYAHAHGVVVEAELGTLAGVEDEVVVEHGKESYTRPEEVEEFIDEQAGLSMAQNNMENFVQYQTARAMRDVVKDQGGWAGIGAEIVLANTMAQNVQKMTSSMECEKSRIEKLRELKELLDEGILTQEEFCAEKKRVLEK